MLLHETHLLCHVGRPSLNHEEWNRDWSPSLYLGYTIDTATCQLISIAVEHHERVASRMRNKAVTRQATSTLSHAGECSHECNDNEFSEIEQPVIISK